MPSAQITSYTAHVGRLGQLGTDRLIVVRHMHLDQNETGQDQNAEHSSEIYFADRFANSELGFHTLGSAHTVQAHLPADAYPEWLDLLRHEAPMYLHWSIADEPGTPESDGIIHLATGPEPPGEGPVDYSR